jgi:hypothetical protein
MVLLEPLNKEAAVASSVEVYWDGGCFRIRGFLQAYIHSFWVLFLSVSCSLSYYI